MAKKIELLHTTYDESGNIESQEVVHPLTSSDCVIMENGMTLEDVMGNDTVIDTPTIMNEDTSFKVGIGDSETKVIDSDVAKMVIEGKTYQNILPKPTTLIMNTDEKEFKINDKIDNNIVLDDNVAEIATVKGQTYVNVVQEESASEYVAIDEELNGQSITTTGKPEGYVKNATLEGMTLVNTIQEPSEANSVVLDLDADIDAQSATIDNTVQGGIKSAILSGMSLVDLKLTQAQGGWGSRLLAAENECYTVTAVTNGVKVEVITQPNNWRYFYQEINGLMMKPSTKYIIFGQFEGNITGITLSNGGSNSVIAKQTGTVQNNRYVILETKDELPSDLTYNSHGVYAHISDAKPGDVYTFASIVVLEYQEGMENWDIPYFEGMKSVEVPSVKTTGKNLYNINEDTTHAWQGTTEFIDGKIKLTSTKNTGVTYHETHPIYVEKGKTYSLSIKREGAYDTYYIWKNGEQDKAISTIASPFTVDESYDFITIGVYTTVGEGNVAYFQIQLEEGSTATTYEPYKSSTAIAYEDITSTAIIEEGCYYKYQDGSKATTSTHNSYQVIVQGINRIYTRKVHSNYTFWTKDGTFISGRGTVDSASEAYAEGSLSVPSNAYYMRCAVSTSTDVSTLYIKKGVQLRKVGDVQDELDLTTGKLTQRVGEVVLDGSQELSVDVSRDNTALIIFNSTQTGLSTSSVCICDKLPFKANSSEDFEHMRMNVNGNVCFWINKTKFEELNVAGVKKYLLQNPITVQYPLVTESVKTVDLTVTDQDNNPVKSIQTQPTVTHITASSNGLIPFVSIPSQLKYPTIIKPSTTYTVQLKQTIINSEFPLTINLGGTVMAVPSTKFTITTPETLTSQDVIFTGKNNVISEVVITEGDTTGIEYPFFEGMNDVKSPKMYATGKNLISVVESTTSWNGANIKSNNDNTITLTPNSDNRAAMNATIKLKTPIKLRAGTQFTYSIRRISGGNEDFSGGINSQLKVLKKDGTTIALPLGDLTKEYFDKVVYKTYTFEKDWDSIIETLPIMWQIVNLTSPITIQIQLEESSTATSYEPYKGVTIEQDIDSIPLTSDMFEQGNINAGDATVINGMSYQQFPKLTTNSDRIKTKTIIPVKPNAKYTINFQGYAIVFDKNGDYVKIGSEPTLDFTSGVEFTIPSNAHYIALCLKYADDSTITPSTLDSLNLTLQEVPQEIVLRSIGDVKDTLNLTRGEYIQRIMEMKPRNAAIVTEKEMDNTILVLLGSSKIVKNNLISNKINHSNVYSKDKEGVYYDEWGLYFRILKSRITALTSEGVKKWLYDNDFTVLIELKTPIIKKVNLTNTTKLPSYASTTHYDTIVPSNSLVPNIKIPSTIDYNVAIKPSTQYTIRANTTSAMSVDLGGSTGTLTNGKVTLTTPSILTHNSLKLGNGKAKEVMVVKGSEIKDNVPFFNGMKNVQMGGIKLVNIARGATCNNLVTANTNKTQFTYTGDGTGWGDILFDKSLLKQNTLYTIYLNVISSNSDNANPLKISMGDDLNTWLNVSSTGLFKQTFTTNDNIDNLFGINFRPCTSGQKVVIQNPMIIEGDWTHLDEIPFIESEMIIEQPIIRSQGKNLSDGKLESGRYAQNQGVPFSDNTAVRTVNKIKVKPSTVYTLKIEDGTNLYNTSEYCNGVYIGCKTAGNSLTFTTSPTTNELHLSFKTDNINLQYQIEEGSTATTYEPFKHQTLYSNRVIGYEDGCYYAWDTGTKTSAESIASVMSDVEGLNVAYVTHASSNFSFYDKDGVYLSGSMFLSTATDLNSYNSNFDRFGFIKIPANAKYMKMACGNTNSGSAKDYHLKATVTGDLPLRSLPNGVCDTLNLVTGEYVQRVGEVILNGSEVWGLNNTNSKTTCYHLAKGHNSQLLSNMKFNTNSMLCNRYAQITQGAPNLSNNEGIFALSSYDAIYINSNIMSTSGSNDFKQYLSQNPITVQYELETPIVRKIGLTAKGNYKEVELNGSEDWRCDINNIDKIQVYIPRLDGQKFYDSIPRNIGGSAFSKYTGDDYHFHNFNIGQNYGITVDIKPNRLHLADNISSKSLSEVATLWKQWLSLNPFKIGYISTAQSATSYSNILKPIFFNNVNVQFMNNNIDIQPVLTLQARSINSYVMDMMKANTTYTLKALNNSSSFTIDGTSYGAGTNGTFTSPLTLTNKLLIAGQDVQELMIIEGDVTGKQLPYYKGIRSSFDNIDKVEVLSQSTDNRENSTIINMPTQLETVEVVRPEMENGTINTGNGANAEDTTNSYLRSDFIPVQPKEFIYFLNGNSDRVVNIICYNKDKNFMCYLYNSNDYVPENCYFVRIYMGKANTSDLTMTRMAYKPIALNELPNGVKDELIINRATSSAKLIRRVGKVVLDGFSDGHDETVAEFNFRKFVIYTGLTSIKVAGQCVTSNNLPCIVNGEVRNTIRLAVDGKIVINIDGFSSINEYFNYLKQNPLTVYYELAEPVITEIRLKGYPFVYEDGSITLNTDIAPVTRTSYNVNQHQLINSQNETIIRHDKQISDLYDYIEIYLDEIYRMELFKMQLELSL